MHREPGLVGGDGKQVGRGGGEFDDKRAWIGRAHADGAEIGGLAGVKCLRTANREKHVSVFRSEGRPKDALVRKHKIGGRDRLAV